MLRLSSFLLAVSVLASTASLAQASSPVSRSPVLASLPAEDPGKQAVEQPQPGAYAPDRVIVGWREPGKGPDQERARGLVRVAELGAPGMAVVSTAGRPVEQVIAELQNDPAVEFAEPDYVIQVAEEVQVAAVGVNDPRTGDQYSLDRMKVRDAWSRSKGASNVIAVLDTGIQYTHPDLQGRIVAGWDFVNNDNDPRDDNRHGTWVSGIIAANSNNGVGIAGISWTDKIMPVKIMNAGGSGYTSDLALGIRWAADHGASIINMSVGGFPADTAVRSAVDYAWSKNIVLVGAAGNNGTEELFYPASFPNVISVSATQVDDEFTHWSSYGQAVDVSAPGDAVLTTDCGGCSMSSAGSPGYAQISGTSFASPNVAGVVALIRARYPTWTAQQVVDRLYATVDDRGYAGWDNRYGRGRVNAYRALGGSPAYPALAPGDGLEPNNIIGAARPIALGTTVRPSIYPAGDVDYFAVTAPRAGRVDIAVTAIVDSRPWPWQLGSLPVDPVLEVYDAAGTLLKRVDDPNVAGATERASVQLAGPARLVVRVQNYPGSGGYRCCGNGNQAPYSVSTAFVDNVAPLLAGRDPSPSAVVIDGRSIATATFNEPVTGVSGSTFALRNAAGQTVPASVSYDAAAFRAVLRPAALLTGQTSYTLTLSSGIRDVAGNAFAGTSWSFTTGRVLSRLAGGDRYATSAVVSGATFARGVAVAYVATGTAFPDALAGGAAAGRAGGPVLLVSPGAIPSLIAAELSRLAPQRIVVLGGPAAVSDTVVARLDAYTAGTVTRQAGADRYATAAAISQAGFAPGAPVAYIATGPNFPDALAGGPAAARNGGPILLVTSGAIPAVTAAELSRLRPGRIVILGGTAVVSDSVAARLAAYTGGGVSRLAGADRYLTATAISAGTFGRAATVYVVTGADFPDALAAAPAAGTARGPLLLVPGSSLPAVVAAELLRLDPSQVVIVGSNTVVTDAVRDQIRALWP